MITNYSGTGWRDRYQDLLLKEIARFTPDSQKRLLWIIDEKDTLARNR